MSGSNSMDFLIDTHLDFLNAFCSRPIDSIYLIRKFPISLINGRQLLYLRSVVKYPQDRLIGGAKVQMVSAGESTSSAVTLRI